MERHLALVAIAEIGGRVFWPLVRLGQQHPARIPGIDPRPEVFQDLVRLFQIFGRRAFLLQDIGHRIQPETIDPQFQPEVDDLEHGLAHRRVFVVEVWLVGVEAVPEIGLGHRIPRPVRPLIILENDPCLAILVRRIAPHVPLPLRTASGRSARPLEPRMLVRGVVEYEFDDDAETARVGGAQDGLEILERPVGGVNGSVIGDVVAVVQQGRGKERQQPDRRHAQVAEVIELADQPLEITDPIAVAVGKGPDVKLVEHRVLVPGRSRIVSGWSSFRHNAPIVVFPNAGEYATAAIASRLAWGPAVPAPPARPDTEASRVACPNPETSLPQPKGTRSARIPIPWPDETLQNPSFNRHPDQSRDSFDVHRPHLIIALPGTETNSSMPGTYG